MQILLRWLRVHPIGISIHAHKPKIVTGGRLQHERHKMAVPSEHYVLVTRVQQSGFTTLSNAMLRHALANPHHIQFVKVICEFALLASLSYSCYSAMGYQLR